MSSNSAVIMRWTFSPEFVVKNLPIRREAGDVLLFKIINGSLYLVGVTGLHFLHVSVVDQ